jgi:hypothetical protein
MEHSLLPRENSKLPGDFQPSSQAERELEIERLASEIGRLIHQSEPDAREDLAQAASALLREEGLRAGTDTASTEATGLKVEARRRPLNPLAAGIGLLVVGAALAVLLPFLGVVLAVCGALAILWGLVISWVR